MVQFPPHNTIRVKTKDVYMSKIDPRNVKVDHSIREKSSMAPGGHMDVSSNFCLNLIKGTSR